MNGNGHDHKTNIEVWRRFKDAVLTFNASKTGKKARRWFLLLTTLLLSTSGLNVVNSYVGRDFISSIEHKDMAGFVRMAWLYLAVFGLSTVAAVMTRYSEETLGVLWREWLTGRMIRAYLDNRAFYHLEESRAVENPDQRITEDVKAFTTSTLSFAIMTLNALITVVAFSGVLWSISPRLFVVAVVYAVVGSLLTVWLGHTLVSLNDRQLDKEANFRSELMHIRENAEALALLHREPSLLRRVSMRLGEVVANTRNMIGVNRKVGFFTTGYNYLIQIMPALVVAPMFIGGKVEFGVITQSAMAFAQLMGAFSLIVTQFQSLSTYAAVITRLTRLDDAMNHLCDTDESPITYVDAPDKVAYEHVTLGSPEGQVFLKDLNVEIPRGTRTLVRSTSGHAKVALFKATAGLSCEGDGKIARPGKHSMLFLPERPFLPKSTLRVLIANGSPPESVTDEKLLAVLHDLHMDGLLAQAGGLDVEHEWSGMTALNEQTMLMLARTLLAAPAFVFLDRQSVTLDTKQAALMLQLLTSHGITYIVMGKPGDPVTSFDATLDIHRDGTWIWRTQAELRREVAVQEAG